MLTLNQLKAIAKSEGYSIRSTGDFDSNGEDKLYAMYIGYNRQSPALTVKEMSQQKLFQSRV